MTNQRNNLAKAMADVIKYSMLKEDLNILESKMNSLTEAGISSEEAFKHSIIDIHKRYASFSNYINDYVEQYYPQYLDWYQKICIVS